MRLLKKHRLDRRTVLRGIGIAGISIALPPLDIMFNDKGLLQGPGKAQAQALPKRIMIFHYPHGGHLNNLIPKANGANWWGSDANPTVPVSMQPLVPHLKDINLLCGLSMVKSYNSGDGDDHDRANSTFMTGVPNANGRAGGVSVDQLAATLIKGSTPIPMLHVSPTDPVRNGRWPMSWKNVNGTITSEDAESDPAKLFSRLFSNANVDSGAAAKAMARKQSVLNFVKQDAMRLQGKLGTSDKKRMDEHLSAIADLERNISSGAVPTSCAVPANEGNSADVEERTRRLLRLVRMAFVCDRTRVVSFSMGASGGDFIWPIAGMTIGDHETSHYGGTGSRGQTSGNIQKYTEATTFKMKQLAYLLELFKVNEATNSPLLNNCIVAMGSEMSNGDWHSTEGVPMMVAGGGMQTGKKLVFPCGDSTVSGFPSNDIPYCTSPANTYTALERLWLTMLKAAGANVNSFGADGSQPLSGLWI